MHTKIWIWINYFHILVNSGNPSPSGSFQQVPLPRAKMIHPTLKITFCQPQSQQQLGVNIRYLVENGDSLHFLQLIYYFIIMA